MRRKGLISIIFIILLVFTGSFFLNGITVSMPWYVLHGPPPLGFWFSLSSDVVVSPDGSIYTTGNGIYWDTGIFGNPLLEMNDFFGDAFVAKWNKKGDLLWYTFMGGPGFDYSLGIDADKYGNVYIAGGSYNAWDTAKYGTPIIPFHNTGIFDAWVAKLNSSGTIQWYTFLGGSDNDITEDIKVSPSGNIYVSGQSGGPWDEGDYGAPKLSYNGIIYGEDIFVSRLNSNGVLQWYTFLGGPDFEFSSGISISPGEDIYVTGEGAGNWPEVKYGLPVNPIGNGEGFGGLLAKLKSNGDFKWYTFMDEADWVSPQGVDVSRTGKVFLTGIALDHTNGIVSAPSSVKSSFSSGRTNGVLGGFETFVASFNSYGEKIWLNKYQIAVNSNGTSIDAAPDNYIYVTGNASDESLVLNNLGKTADIGLPPSYAYAMKLSPQGKKLWLEIFSKYLFGVGMGISAGPFGSVYITGTTLNMYFISAQNEISEKSIALPNENFFLLKLNQFYNVTVRVKTEGGTVDHENHTVRPGDKCEINMYPDEGYEIDKIIDNGEEVETVNPYILSNVNEDHTVDVYFRLIQYPPELILTGIRLTDKAWIIQKEFSEITVTIVEHPTSPMEVKKYVLYKYKDDEWKEITNYTGPGVYTYMDKFLVPGETAKYILKAIAPDGTVVAESEILIL